MASNFGQFAGSFARAFSSAQNAKAEKEERDKEAKLRGQLLELQVKQIQKQTEAQGRTEARLQPGGFDRPGRLAELVPSGSTEIGGRGVPQFESAGASPQELMQDPQSLSDLIVSGQARLADFAGKPQKRPKELDLLEAAGIDFQSEEGREALLSSVGGNEGQFDNLMAGLNIQLAEAKIQEQRIEREKNERTEHQRVAGTKVSIRNDFKHAKEILTLQRELADTALQVGVPYGDFSRDLQSGVSALAGLTGFDVTKVNSLIAKRDRLTKLFADGIVESIDRFAGTGAITNAKFQALTEATPNIDNSADANGLLLADRLEAMLDGAEIDGMDVEERADMEAFIKMIRAGQPSSRGGPVIDVPAGAKKVGNYIVETLPDAS